MKQTYSIIVCLLFCISLTAQPDSAHRPKVGLVLSGGGAKGITHIGVLKVLEKAGLEFDYISGTSMGSIVGGLYALGYSADTLEQLVTEQNWDKVLSDRIPLNEVIFEEKIFFENQLFEFGIEDYNVITPSGLIQGQQIANLLSRYCFPAYYIDHFDDLPIPFRCIGTDLSTSETVVIEEGYLPEALRISMAIPTVFTAIKKDDKILVDGGMVHNFPASEVQEMGADIIIGVYAGKKSATEEELGTIAGILGQSIFLMSIRDAEVQEVLCDYYVEPDLTGYGAQDFRWADSIIWRGEQAAMKQFDVFKSLADSLNQLGAPYPKKKLPPTPFIKLDRIDISGNEQYTDMEIRGRFGIQEGEFAGPKDIENGINHLYGTNYFDRVSYSLRETDDQNVLTIHCIEKTPFILRGALNYDSYLNVGVLGNLTMRNWLLPASRLMIGGKIADNFRANIQYLKYLGPSQEWSVVLGTQFNRDQIPIVRGGLLTEEYDVLDFPIDLRLQKRLGRNIMIGVGAQREVTNYEPTAGDLPVDNLIYRNYNIYGSFELNTLNQNILPDQGTQLSLEFKRYTDNRLTIDPLEDGTPPPGDSLLGISPYNKITLQMQSYIRLNPRNSIVLEPFIGIAGNSGSIFADFYLIGAPEKLTRRSIPFYGLKANELIAQVAVGAGIGYQHFLRNNLMVGLNVNAGYFEQPGRFDEDTFDEDLYLYGAGLTVGYNSFLGPIKFTLMHPFSNGGNVENNLKAFLFFGHRF